MRSFKENPEEIIIQEIRDFVSKSPDNRNSKMDSTPYFETPLVGFADVCDPLFLEFKDIIGDFYLTPLEILERSFPEHEGSWDGSSVVSWILPFSRSIRERNRRETHCSSKVWALAKTYGEELNIKLREHIASFIKDRGFIAIVPTLSPLFEVLQSEEVGFTSNWSERHVAYVAGLGTFGLSGGLITKSGIAMRCGSVVTNLKLNPTQRPYSNHQEYCLFYGSNTCGKCIERCPGGAISEKGHNKELCMVHCAEIMQKSDEYDTVMPTCGLCQTAVPCEAGIPRKIIT
jgi:epoxyqueuosine reductase QueG